MSATGKDILEAKVSVPSELRTAQWSALPTWIRERAFFMASVDRAEVLDSFRDKVTSMSDGELSTTQARKLLREDLDKLDYKPMPGQESTIKDLTSSRRLNVALETNLSQVHGFAAWTRQQGALDSFPAQRFVRLRMSKVPREDWPERFAAAVGNTTSDGANVGAMCALVNHPCWIALSVFGSPYAPFDFNSGMGLEPMDRDEADALGLMPAEDADPEHAGMMEPQDRGLNETLEASPEIRSQVIRTALADELHGLAKWDKDRIVFTDPNGTKKYKPSDLADIWEAGTPTGIPLLQRKAALEWHDNPDTFRDRGGRDKWEDFVRLSKRVKPDRGVPKNPEAKLIARIGSLSDADLKELVKP